MSEPPPSARDLARQALEQAKADARARRRDADSAQAAARRADTRRSNLADRPARPDAGGPVAFGEALAAWVADRGYDIELSVARVLSAWDTLVGPAIAAHSRPVTLRAGELVIEADSTAWATQLRLLERTVLEALAAELGDGVVASVVVHGPSGPSWQKGAWRVPGRGPRDTYG